MRKPAPAQYPIHPLISERWSPYAFDARRVEPEKLQRLFEAARWSPSSSNEQPWSFLVAQSFEAEDFNRMASVLFPGNAWAKNAPVLALSVTRLRRAGTDARNRHAYHDVGLAMGSLLVQATAEGLIVHQMAGFDEEKARAVLHIPNHHDPVAIIAIGYPGDTNALPPSLHEREQGPRKRKPIDQFVFAGRWGTEAKL